MTLDRQLVVDAMPNYEVGGEVGRGGWAVVLHARHRILDREVAIKQLPVAFGADPVVRARFVEEARLVAKLDHPHIAPVYDFVEKDAMCLIVMEFLAGGSLWDRFREHGVRYDEACGYIIVACSALEHAHGYGILHRDIKPENFLFDDRPGIIKLSDFGIAKVLGTAALELTAAGQIIGTPAYMAPEQILSRPVSAATDVYACGTMLYELMSGTLPFEGGTSPIAQLAAKVDKPPRPLRDIRPDVAAPLADVVMKAIATDPADRFHSAAEFGEALAEAATLAFGVGWLRRSGVKLLGGGDYVRITERQPAAAVRRVEVNRTDVHQVVKATMAHPRLAELMAEAKRTIGSPPKEVPEPPPVASGPVEIDAQALGTRAKSTDPEVETHIKPEYQHRSEHDAQEHPAGWYEDPRGRFELRYWDGRSWSDYVCLKGVVVLDRVDT
jgi:serine/threonine-protein kinase